MSAPSLLILNELKQDLFKYSNMTKSQLWSECIDIKLKVTLNNYKADLEMTQNYLETRESSRIMKALVTIQKQNYKNVIEDAIEKNKAKKGENKYD